MIEKKKMTVRDVSVAADTEQSKSNKTNTIITDKNRSYKSQAINIFETVKNQVSVSATAQLYGINVRRDGFINCIFHNDRHPSMKLYKDHYHCFSCQAHGDIIAFTAQIYGLSQIEAACKLANDIGIDVGGVKSPTSTKTFKRKTYLTENEAYILLHDYVTILKIYEKRYCPFSPQEELHPLYVQALHELSTYENYLDIFTTGSKEDQKDFLINGRRIFDELRAKLRTAKMAVRRK